MQASTCLRILIVDDNDLTRALLGVILRGSEFKIVGQAENVPSGLAMARDLRPDIILLDILMPGPLGLDAIRPFKEMLPNAMVLMVSGQDNDEWVQQALSEGACGYISKPFNSQSVLETIKRLSGAARKA